MVRRGKLATQIAVFTVGWLVYGSEKRMNNAQPRT
jgi:hypothetical protein